MDKLDQISAIARVTYYQASPVRTCDRCSSGIKHVFVVTFRDGLRQEYGSECINRVLDSEPTLRKLFNKNVKLLQIRQRALRTLSLPEDQIPRGTNYYNRGLWFIADETGNDVMTTHFFFHPSFTNKPDADAQRAEFWADIEKGKTWLQQDIARLESFLANIMRSAKVVAA